MMESEWWLFVTKMSLTGVVLCFVYLLAWEWVKEEKSREKVSMRLEGLDLPVASTCNCDLCEGLRVRLT